MEARTPIAIVTGSLGSGKTTLLRHLIETVSKRMAILMNEFGEISIDNQIIEGNNIRMTELGGGCVCCSLAGEFDSFGYRLDVALNRQKFEAFADGLGSDIVRAKGFVRFENGTYLFNFVAGRWELEHFDRQGNQLVFIGRNISDRREEILSALKACEA